MKIVLTPKFRKSYNKLDNTYKKKAKKQIDKIIDNPYIGKPMSGNRKGTREVYVKPFRLAYTYIIINEKLIFLNIYHKDEQ